MTALGVASIGVLFSLGCPSAISRLVVAIVVDSVDAMAWRRWLAHVCNERFEAVRPALAHADASCAVPLVVWSRRVSASGDHRAPRVIHPRAGASVLARASEHFTVKAPAALCDAVLQVVRADVDCVSAFATALPSRWLSLAFPWEASNHCEPARYVSEKGCSVERSHGYIFSNRGAACLV